MGGSRLRWPRLPLYALAASVAISLALSSVLSRGWTQNQHVQRCSGVGDLITAASPGQVPPPAAAGAMVIRRTIEELTAAADRIIVGRVSSLQSRFAADCTGIVTAVSLEIETAFKGPSAERIAITLPGGSVGDSHLSVGGVPYFLPGERVLLFLNDLPALGPRLTGLWQGKFSLMDNEALQPESGERLTTDKLASRIVHALEQPVELSTDQVGYVAPFVTRTPCFWSSGDMPVPYFVNTAISGPNGPGPGAPSGPAFARLAHESHQRWQNLPDSFLAARFAGSTARNGRNHTDGFNDIVYGIEPANNAPETLAVNYCFFSTVGGVVVDIDSDTQIDNDSIPWSATDPPSKGRLSLRSVVTHELGHFWGLRHTNALCRRGDADRPLMCPNIAPGETMDIQADDRAGVASLYPLAGAPPATPKNLTVTIAPGGTSVSWSDVEGELYNEVWRASDSCSADFASLGTTASNATRYNDDNFGAGLAAGAYCYKVRAGGNGGDSPFSEAVAITIVTATTTPGPTATPTPSPGPTPSPTPSPGPTPSPSPSPSPTPSPTPSPRPKLSVPLVAGLNILVSPVSAPLPVALTNVLGDVQAVFFFNATTQSWLWFFPTAGEGVNSLSFLTADQIYFFLTVTAATWNP